MLIRREIPEELLNQRINALSVRNQLLNVAADVAERLNSDRKKLAYLFLSEYASSLPELKDDERLADSWAIKEMERLGFTNGWIQECTSAGLFNPDFVRGPEPGSSTPVLWPQIDLSRGGIKIDTYPRPAEVISITCAESERLLNTTGAGGWSTRAGEWTTRATQPRAPSTISIGHSTTWWRDGRCGRR